MGYVHAIKGSFLAFIVFILAVIYIPGNGPLEEVKIILTVSTFLFAIIAGFFIARLNSRYDKIKECVAEEDAYWLSFYYASKFFGKKFTDKIRDILDKYYMHAYDYDYDYYKPTAKQYESMYDELGKVKYKKNSKADNVFSKMIDLLAKIETRRNKTAIIAVEKLIKSQWIVLFLLGTIIVFSLYYIKVPELYSQVVVVLLSTILVLILLIMRDLQNLRLMGQSPIGESGQEVLEEIGKLRYYNQIYLKNKLNMVPDFVKKYRLGTHKPGEKPQIKIIKR